MIGFLSGFIIDQLIGDPRGIPHPVVFIGKLIAWLDKHLLKQDETNESGGNSGRNNRGNSGGNSEIEFFLGICLVAIVLTITVGVSICLTCLTYGISPWIGMAYEAVVTWQLLACRDLKKESMLVYEALKNGSLDDARYAVSRIVGRDTASLDEAGIIRAAVETVAENTSDGVIAPMLYLAAFGPAGGFLYKAVNTMDSMVGYKNERYMHFGTAAARLDDVLNFLPSRICALIMILCCGSKMRDAWRIFLRDRFNHKSPNSAQTESVMAGALGLRLGGDSYYFGELHHKLTIGDPVCEIEPEDIKRANILLYRTAYAGELLCLAVMLIHWM